MTARTPQIQITSYGALHHDPPPGDGLLIDLTEALRNPHKNPAMRHRTGLDADIRAHVLDTPGARELVVSIADRAELLLGLVHENGQHFDIARESADGHGGAGMFTSFASGAAIELVPVSRRRSAGAAGGAGIVRRVAVRHGRYC